MNAKQGQTNNDGRTRNYGQTNNLLFVENFWELTDSWDNCVTGHWICVMLDPVKWVFEYQ